MVCCPGFDLKMKTENCALILISQSKAHILFCKNEYVARTFYFTHIFQGSKKITQQTVTRDNYQPLVTVIVFDSCFHACVNRKVVI